MSAEQRNLLPSVEEGKIIFNTTSGCLNYYQNKRWRVFCEEKKNVDQNVVYDEKTGRLKYMMNGQWYEFDIVGTPVQTTTAEEKHETDESTNTVADSRITDECQTKPTRAYAGRDLVGFDRVELEGNEPLNGKAFWQILKGEGGQFVDSTVPNTTFAGIQGTTYVLRYNIYTKCDTFFDEALIRIRPPCDPEPSISFAGIDQLNVTEAYLSANNPKSGKGSWIIVSGLGGKFDNPINPRTRFTGREGETYILRWLIRNECGVTQDDVIIKIKPACSPVPDVAYAGENQIDVENCMLVSNNPKKGTGKWSITEGGKGRFEQVDSTHTRFIGMPGKKYVLRWTVSTKCGSNTDEVEVKFSASCPDEFYDTRDGTKYHGIRLAGECWMKENLRYRPEELKNYCYDELNYYCNEYGGLYPWETAMNHENKESSRGLCPKGWHVPSDAEWQHLIDSSTYAPKELLMGGLTDFDVPMGGSRYSNGKYFNRGEYAYYWSSSSGKNENTAWNRYFPNKSNTPDHHATNITHSFSVRCVKDDD